jgi:cytochrome P450 family 142 subfamily A polypeptide 1
MLETLLERLPDLELAVDPDDPTQVPMRPANFITGPEALPVRFSPTASVGAGPV